MFKHHSMSLLICAVAGAALADERPAPSINAFNRDVKPVLAKLCLRCHGPQEQEGVR